MDSSPRVYFVVGNPWPMFQAIESIIPSSSEFLSLVLGAKNSDVLLDLRKGGKVWFCFVSFPKVFSSLASGILGWFSDGLKKHECCWFSSNFLRHGSAITLIIFIMESITPQTNGKQIDLGCIMFMSSIIWAENVSSLNRS